MRTRIFSWLIFGFLFFLSQPSQAQKSPDPKLLEGAKKEGEIVWYTSMALDQSKPVADAFEKKYPFIKVTLFRSGGGALMNKVLTEARAGRYAFDVVGGRGELGMSATTTSRPTPQAGQSRGSFPTRRR